MDTLVTIVIEAICAALVIYILYRETFTSARSFEARIAGLLRGTRNG